MVGIISDNLFAISDGSKILAAVSGCLLVVWTLQRRGPKNPPPGPWGLPVVGYLPFLGKDTYLTFAKLAEKYGKHVYQIYMGSRRTVLVNSLEAAKQVLVTQSDDFADRPDFHSYQHFAEGNSVAFHSFSPRTRMHKKIARSALRKFTLNSANPMEETFWTEGSLLIDDLLKVKDKPAEIHEFIQLTVASVIYKLCYGSEKACRQDELFLEYLSAQSELHHLQGSEGNPIDLMPWVKYVNKYIFTDKKEKQRIPVVQRIRRFIRDKIDQHFAEYVPDNIRDIGDALIFAAEDTPAEDLQAVGLTKHHIMCTLYDLVGGGQETVTATLRWAILYLTTHPDLQDKVIAEIDDIIGDALPHPLDRKKMPFTEAFLLETWRYCCLDAFLLPHAASRDAKLYGYDIPKGTTIMVNMWSVNRDPEAWSNPMAFDPTRFLNEDGFVQKDMAEDVMAFGAGKRRCIGELMGRQESFVLLVMMLQKVYFEKVPGVTYDLKGDNGLTLTPVDYEYIVRERC